MAPLQAWLRPGVRPPTGGRRGHRPRRVQGARACDRRCTARGFDGVVSAPERVPRTPGVTAWPWVLELGGVPRCAHLTSSSLMHHYCPSRLNALHVWRGHHSLQTYAPSYYTKRHESQRHLHPLALSRERSTALVFWLGRQAQEKRTLSYNNTVKNREASGFHNRHHPTNGQRREGWC